jgi:hypothetical protein
MKQKSLAKWLKVTIIGVALAGLAVLFVIIPILGQGIVGQNPEFEYCYYPWLVLFWVCGIPCYIALVLGWMIAVNIGKDRSFSLANAHYLSLISVLAAIDSALFFTVNIVFLLLNMNHPGIVLLSLIVVFIGVAISVAAAALSHLVMKAAELQEQSDLTI